MRTKTKIAISSTFLALGTILGSSILAFRHDQSQQVVNIDNQKFVDSITSDLNIEAYKETTGRPDDSSDTNYKYKIDITASLGDGKNSLKNFRDFRVRDFYSDSTLFEQLVDIIKKNPSILFRWADGSGNTIENIQINIANDERMTNIGAAAMQRSMYKDLNGRLYIDVTVGHGPASPNTSIYSFILCGFKRDAMAFLDISEETKKVSTALYNSAMYGNKIKLNNNNETNNTEFVLSNTFYYKNYLQPTESNLTPITPTFVIQGKDFVKIRTDAGTGNDKINFPSELNGQIIKIDFWSNENSSIVKPLLISLGAICVPLIIIIAIILGRIVRKKRHKID